MQDYNVMPAATCSIRMRLRVGKLGSHFCAKQLADAAFSERGNLTRMRAQLVTLTGKFGVVKEGRYGMCIVSTH